MIKVLKLVLGAIIFLIALVVTIPVAVIKFITVRFANFGDMMQDFREYRNSKK